MVDTLESLREFRRKYNFPDNVKVKYCSESEAILSRGEGRVVIPLVAIVEGGLRIPMSDLLTNFLHHFKVFPNQCTPNVFRIFSSVDTLNKKLRLKHTEHDINYIYSSQDSKTSGFYFKIWHGEVRLISGLLDSDKETEKDYLIVYPISVSKAGGRHNRIFFLLTNYYSSVFFFQVFSYILFN